MRSKLFLLTILLLTISASSVHAYLEDPWYKISVAAPGGPIKEQGFFQTSLYSGSANYIHPIEVPPGTNGLAPEIILSYNSHGARGKAGFVGSGWSLTENYIQRDVNYTADSTSDDKFILVLNGQSYELVYDGTEGRYHTKVESYLNIENKTGSPLNQKGEYWLVTTKDGTKYRFGYNSDSETLSSIRDYVWRWSLDEVEDTHNNHIYYSYQEDPTSNDTGTVYLSKIEYNNDKKRVIDFVLESIDRPDKITTFYQGSKIQQARRLEEIVISADSSLVRKYVFSYSMNPSTTKSLLDSITQYASDGATSLPSTRFTYQTKQVGWAENSSWRSTMEFVEIRDGNPTANRGVRFGDVNGDGLEDILRRHTVVSDTYQNAFINNGHGWTLNNTWLSPVDFIYNDGLGGYGKYDYGTRMVDVNGDGRADIIRGYKGNRGAWISNSSGWTSDSTWNPPYDFIFYYDSQTLDSGLRIADVNGDGQVDLIRGFYGTRQAWINNGNGWTRDDSWAPNLDFISKIDNKYRDNGLRIADVNGDGLVDLIRGHNGVRGAWINNGNGWTQDNTWNPPTDFIIYYVSGGVGSYIDNGVRLGDVNGDGLVDLVRGTENTWQAWINNGHGWTRNDSWTPRVSFKGSQGDIGSRVADVNGDGLVDHLTQTSKAWINKVPFPDVLSKVQTSQGGTIAITYISSSKFDNTGNDSIPDLSYNLWVVNSTTIDNGMTGDQHTKETYTYEYANGLYDHEDKEFRGFGYVKETDPRNTTTEHYFHQDDARKGREYKTIIEDGVGNPYTKTENTWSYTEINGKYNKTFLDQTDEYTYDGVSSNPKKKTTQYDYDSYGNVIKVSSLGEAAAGDEKYLLNEYTYSTSAWIVDKVNHSYLQDENLNKVSESWYYYDGHTSLRGF